MQYDRDEILSKVKDIIAEVLNMDKEEIRSTSRFVEDLGAESLDFITMLMEFEDAFKESISEDDARTLVTVNDVVTYIIKKIK